MITALYQLAYFKCAGPVPGPHQVCSPTVLPGHEVVERNPGFPVKGARQIKLIKILLFVSCHAAFFVSVILPVPCSECTSLGGDPQGFYLMEVYSCIYHARKAHNK